VVCVHYLQHLKRSEPFWFDAEFSARLMAWLLAVWTWKHSCTSTVQRGWRDAHMQSRDVDVLTEPSLPASVVEEKEKVGYVGL
jgi:hypothetical protein